MSQSSTSRKIVLGAMVAVFAATGLWQMAGTPAPAKATPVDMTLLKTPGPLPEMSMGDPSAPVTVIEYASMTCGHCAKFMVETFPKVKKELVDTGKVRFVSREFPLDPVAVAGAMLVRCAPADKAHDLTERLFMSQSAWATADDKVAALAEQTTPFGLDVAAVRACLSDETLQKKVLEVKETGRALGVTGTPTFFVDGVRTTGAMSYEQLAAAAEAAPAK